MAEYIEKSRLKKEIVNWAVCLNNPSALGRSDTMFVIDNIEAADVVPVVHAHWIDWGIRDDDGNGEYTCSCCGHNDKHSPNIKVPYCWHCGAKMDAR